MIVSFAASVRLKPVHAVTVQCHTYIVTSLQFSECLTSPRDSLRWVFSVPVDRTNSDLATELATVAVNKKLTFRSPLYDRRTLPYRTVLYVAGQS